MTKPATVYSDTTSSGAFHLSTGEKTNGRCSAERCATMGDRLYCMYKNRVPVFRTPFSEEAAIRWVAEGVLPR